MYFIFPPLGRKVEPFDATAVFNAVVILLIHGARPIICALPAASVTLGKSFIPPGRVADKPKDPTPCKNLRLFIGKPFLALLANSAAFFNLFNLPNIQTYYSSC